MICVVIKGPTIEEATCQIIKALPHADLVELRLDHFTERNPEGLKQLQITYSIPMIFTLRSQLQGGNYTGSEEDRLKEMKSLAQLKPDYLDVESHVSPQFIRELTTLHPEIKLIVSYHDFTGTPEKFDQIYEEMKFNPAFYYKIAVMAKNTLDALRLICWVKEHRDKNIIAVSMGAHGQMSRILAPIMGSPITYACLEKEQESALGQLTAQTLSEVYRYPLLSPTTGIYGLIGEGEFVDLSISDRSHNHLIQESKLDAVYIKMKVKKEELPDFFYFAKKLGLRGLSVTIPLKESVLEYLDRIEPQAEAMGAVNTLHFDQSKIEGYNTDGKGALKAIEEIIEVEGKKVVIIGAGGSAKAIAYKICQSGGDVTILNRDVDKAEEVAKEFNCIGKGLDHMSVCYKNGYDLIINCTPISLPIDPDHILPKSTVMDIKTKPRDTLFLQHAKEKNCSIIYGYQMFVEQAVEQFSIWFKENINPGKSKKILEQEALRYI